jgi:DNA-binding transcriptional LysR family regulator
MDLRALDVFCKIVELRSFSRAAEAVLLTQPTVSGHIKALEAELGIRLFDRAARMVTPTRAGELLYGYACRLLALREEAMQALHAHKGGLSGHLTIGASNIPGAYMLPPLMATFKRAHPDVTLSLHVSGSRDIVRSVLGGSVELGVVGARFDEGRVQYLPIAQDELVVAVAGSHPWSGRGSVRLRELAGQPFVMRERGSGTRKITEEALRERGMDPARLHVVLEVTSNEAVRQALKAGAGLAVISRRAIEDDIRSKQVSVLRVPALRLTREFFLVTHKSRSRSPLAAAFLSFLQAAGKPGGH